MLLAKKWGILIKKESERLKRNATDLWELTFDVSRYLDTDGILTQSDYYDSVDDMMRLYLESADIQAFFVIDSEPVIKGDGYQETKSVTAHSIECELRSLYLKNFKINCGTPDSQEYLAWKTDPDGNTVSYDVNPYTILPYEYISLVNYGDTQLSLLHLALQSTGWTVKEGIDEELCKIKRSFETSDSVYSFLMKSVSPAARVIFEFDRKHKTVGMVKTGNLGTTDNPTQYRTADEGGWNSLTSEEQKAFTSKSAYITQLNQYLDYMAFDSTRDNSITKTQCKGIIRTCDDEIAKRLSQIGQIEAKQRVYDQHRTALANAVLLNQNFKMDNPDGTCVFLFDENDMNVINSMIREQEFSDANIITTSLDDVISTVDIQETLYQSAAAKLHELSQPQYSFHTDDEERSEGFFIDDTENGIAGEKYLGTDGIIMGDYFTVNCDGFTLKDCSYRKSIDNYFLHGGNITQIDGHSDFDFPSRIYVYNYKALPYNQPFYIAFHCSAQLYVTFKDFSVEDDIHNIFGLEYVYCVRKSQIKNITDLADAKNTVLTDNVIGKLVLENIGYINCNELELVKSNYEEVRDEDLFGFPPVSTCEIRNPKCNGIYQLYRVLH